MALTKSQHHALYVVLGAHNTQAHSLRAKILNEELKKLEAAVKPPPKPDVVVELEKQLDKVVKLISKSGIRKLYSDARALGYEMEPVSNVHRFPHGDDLQYRVTLKTQNRYENADALNRQARENAAKRKDYPKVVDVDLMLAQVELAGSEKVVEKLKELGIDLSEVMSQAIS